MSQIRHFDVLILGGGFAGVYCARRVTKRLKGTGKRVGLIANENHMVFQPMLAEVVGGSLSPRHVIHPLRMLCEDTDVFKGTVKGVDTNHKTVTIDGGLVAGLVTFSYEHLVLTLGAEVDLSRMPGMSEHAHLVRNVGDAMKLRTTIIEQMEEANLIEDSSKRKEMLSFVVVGGGYSGVETAGQMIDLLQGMSRFYEVVQPEDFSVTLVHSGSRLLPTLTEKLANYTGRQLEKMGVKIIYNSRVKAVTSRSITLADGTKFTGYHVVCTVGNAPHPVIIKLGESNSIPVEQGHVLVENTGRVVNSESLWSAGDCSRFPKIDGGFCPETAQFAYRQGILIGDNISNTILGKPLQTFDFKGLGELASIGHQTAVAEIFGYQFSGLLAWFMWRSIYLMKLPGFERKLKVMAEWTFELFFSRDINLLTPRYSSPLREMHLEPGDILFREGEPAFSLYAIKDGVVEIRDHKGDMVKRATKGDHFGERALLQDQVYRYHATAVEPTTLVAIAKRTFDAMVNSMGSISKLFHQTAAHYDTPQHISEMVNKLPEKIRKAKVREIMTKNIATLNAEDNVQAALQLFQRERHSTYPVLNPDGSVLGILRRGECYEWLKHEVHDASTTLSQLPLYPALQVLENATVAEAFEALSRSGLSKAAVTSDTGELQGMITVYDLMIKMSAAEKTSSETPS